MDHERCDQQSDQNVEEAHPFGIAQLRRKDDVARLLITAREIARDVLAQKSRSYVQAAKELAEFVMLLPDEAARPSPSSNPPTTSEVPKPPPVPTVPGMGPLPSLEGDGEDPPQQKPQDDPETDR